MSDKSNAIRNLLWVICILLAVSIATQVALCSIVMSSLDDLPRQSTTEFQYSSERPHETNAVPVRIVGKVRIDDSMGVGVRERYPLREIRIVD